MQDTETLIRKIEESLDALRRAVEYRDYGVFDSLLREQRMLLQSVPPSDPQIRPLVLRGRELVHWAITMIKIQRSGYVRSLVAILNSKRLDSHYTDPAPCADSLSLQG